MGSIFTSIIDGEIPCHKVWEDDNHLAFLDIRPIQPGHCLVIPKREISYIFDMDETEYSALWSAVRTVEKKLRIMFLEKLENIPLTNYIRLCLI